MTNHEPTPVPKSMFKWVAIPVLISIFFMGILYIAVVNEPDYMPAQQKKAAGIDVHAKHANAATKEDTSITEHNQATTSSEQVVIENPVSTENQHAH